MIPQPHGGALAPQWKPGESGNQAGSSSKTRFKAAVARALRKRMQAGDEDELDRPAEKLVQLALEARDKVAAHLLLHLYAREDGPVEQRIAGPNGGGIPLTIAMVLHDTRESAKPKQEPESKPKEGAG